MVDKRLLVCAATVSVALCGCFEEPVKVSVDEAVLAAAPLDAVPCPADYDGDGRTDFALKGSNGIWYIDVAICNHVLDRTPEAELACGGGTDDDLDEAVTNFDPSGGLANPRINDGCPAVGAPETNCADQVDDDGDGLVNDGCPSTGRYCQGLDGFAGRWDFAYSGYGDANAIPVPADYGRVDGSVDPQHRADIAIKDNVSGMWAIDYADNGFGTWDVISYGYGDASAVPVPADYDGDGRADMAVKTSAGQWLIDYAYDGFHGWNAPNAGCIVNCTQLPAIYGGPTWIPVPGDYNGDGRADLAIKNELGSWKVDWSNTSNTGFGAWNEEPGGYGDANAVPVLFNYDPWRDNRVDRAIKTKDAISPGDWYIDYAYSGLGWDVPCAGPATGCSSTLPVRGYGGDWSTAIPGDYDGDGIVDLSIKDTNGFWYIDLGYNGWFGWDYIPGTALTAIGNVNRPLLDTRLPYITGVTIEGPNGVTISPDALKIGVRYTAIVNIQPGDGTFPMGSPCGPGDSCPAPLTCYSNFGSAKTCEHLSGLEVNPDLHVPASLHVLNPLAENRWWPITSNLARRFSFTCSQWGEFPLGFMFRDNNTLASFNPDYGMKVTCTSTRPGLYGQVTIKQIGARESNCDDAIDNDNDGLVNDGCPLAGATITAGGFTATSASSTDLNFRGTWQLPQATSGPYTVNVTKAGYSPTVAVNVKVGDYPVGSVGVQIDTPLEESFSSLGALGISYKLYIDYSRGRTLLHVVTLDATKSPVRLRVAPADASGDHDELLDIAIAQNTPMIINGIWWYIHDANTIADDTAQGYFWSLGSVPAETDPFSSGVNYLAAPYGGPGSTNRIEQIGYLPMFGVSGSGNSQRFSILMTEADFTNPNSTTWKQTANGSIYDVKKPFNSSDYNYAMQCSPMLLNSGQVIAENRPNDGSVPWDYFMPRTSVGVNSTGTTAWLVLADGEHVHGSGGASFNQLGMFFKDVLHATTAMNFDGGESTELVLRGANRIRMINTLTSENHAADNSYTPSGRVFSYLSAGQ